MHVNAADLPAVPAERPMADSSVPDLFLVDNPEGYFRSVPVGHQAADPSVDHFVPDPDRVVLQEADPSADRQTAAQVEDSPVPDLIPVDHPEVGFLLVPVVRPEADSRSVPTVH